jgi:hypothetical protein
MLATLRRLTAKAQPWSDRLARLGFIAKAVVYLAVAGFALTAIAGLGGEATGPSGVLRDAAATAVGRTMIGVVTLGLIAHALFRGLLAFIGEPYGPPTPGQRLARRITNATVALGYGGLAASAAALSIGGRAPARADDDATAQHWSARALHAPLGRLLLLAVAVVIAVVAVVHLARVAFPGPLLRRLRMEEMSAGQRLVAGVLGRLAYLSRAIILGTIAYYLWKAAILRSPGQARGPGGALHAAWEFPHGNVLLAMMAGGLVAVGAFALLEARWRRLFRP